jgi:hypothetical protein
MHPKSVGFVPRTLPPVTQVVSSRASREREAKAYWDGLNPQEEAWVLRKVRIAHMGRSADSVTPDQACLGTKPWILPTSAQ